MDKDYLFCGLKFDENLPINIYPDEVAAAFREEAEFLYTQLEHSRRIIRLGEFYDPYDPCDRRRLRQVVQRNVC